MYHKNFDDYFFICSSSDEETEDLIKQKDNILPKDRKRKRHDTKKKVFRLIQSASSIKYL